MRTLIIVGIIILIGALTVVAFNIPIPPIQPSSGKLLITSDDLAGTPRLQQYLQAHTDVKMVTTSEIYATSTDIQIEEPLLVSSIQSISLSGHALSWEDFFILTSPSLKFDDWDAVGWWNQGTYHSVATFIGSRYIRLNGYLRDVVGDVTINYDTNKQVVVHMDKLAGAYSWGSWHVSVSGKVQFVNNNPMKLYNYIWSQNPSALMILGDTSKVPAFWVGYIDLNNIGGTVQALTDHPYTVKNVLTDGKLLRTLPFSRIPLQTPSDVETVINKREIYSPALKLHSTVVRDTVLGYAYCLDYMIEAVQSLSPSYAFTRIERMWTEITVAETKAAINADNDFVILGGHGSETLICCCQQPYLQASDMRAMSFTSHTIGVSYGCNNGYLGAANTLGEEFITSPTSNGYAYLAYGTFTDIASLAFVFHHFVLTYRTMGFGEAVKYSLNQLESMWAIWKSDPSLRNDGFVVQSLCINFFGWAW